mgnify:CR=1 FL=1
MEKYGQECKYDNNETKIFDALHMTKNSCQLFILNTEIMDKDKDMGCVLSLGAMPSKFYRPSGHFYARPKATDRWAHHGHLIYSRDSGISLLSCST